MMELICRESCLSVLVIAGGQSYRKFYGHDERKEPTRYTKSNVRRPSYLRTDFCSITV